MDLHTIELWIGWAGAAAIFALSIVVLIGFRRGRCRVQGRVSGAGLRFLHVGDQDDAGDRKGKDSNLLAQKILQTPGIEKQWQNARQSHYCRIYQVCHVLGQDEHDDAVHHVGQDHKVHEGLVLLGLLC